MKFFVVGLGDMSVGISPSYFEVEIKDFPYDWDFNTISQFKKMLADFDDNRTKVYTEKEFWEARQ